MDAVDHAGIGVADLDQASARFAKRAGVMPVPVTARLGVAVSVEQSAEPGLRFVISCPQGTLAF